MATRKQIRARLAALMNSELTGVGHVLAKVYGHPAGDITGAWPMAILGPTGSKPTRPAAMAAEPTVHRFRIQVLVKYAEVDAAGLLVLDADGVAVWTEENATDTLDVFASELDAFLQTHRTDSGYWIAVDYGAETEIDIVTGGDGDYLRETYALAITCV